MTIKEKIADLEVIKALIEWERPIEYQTTLDEVIADLKQLDNARLCEHCANHTDSGCKKWDCDFEWR